MLFVLYTDLSVKFTEYIPQFIVRATSGKKARELARAAYPKHPLDLMSPLVHAAEIQGMRLLAPKAGHTAHSPFYFCEEGTSQTELRALAARLGPDCDKALWLDETRSEFVDVPPNGRAMLLARTENRTPAIHQAGRTHPVFAWRVVTDRWPNPDADPISEPVPVPVLFQEKGPQGSGSAQGSQG